MPSCCGVGRDYENITDDFYAPSKSSICCGRSYQWLKGNGTITQIAFLALAMVTAGITAYLKYSPRIDAAHGDNDDYIVPLGIFLGVCGLISFCSEGYICCTPTKVVRRVPNPCTLTFGCVVVSAIVLKVQLGIAEDMILSYQMNHTLVTERETSLISGCRQAIVADPMAFTNESCDVCSSNFFTWGSTWASWMHTPGEEVSQLYRIPVADDLCFYQNVPYDNYYWGIFHNIFANVSEEPQDYPCGSMDLNVENDTISEILAVFNYLLQRDWHPPMILNVTDVNQSQGNLIGCKHLDGFVYMKYPLSFLCNQTRRQIPAYPMEMPCQTPHSTAYFNQLSREFKNITSSAIPKPKKAYEVKNHASLLGWVIAMIASGTAAAAYGGGSHYCAEKDRKESALLISHIEY